MFICTFFFNFLYQSHSFQCICLSSRWLNSFLVILFFLILWISGFVSCNEIHSLVLTVFFFFFLVESLGFCLYNIMSSANSDCFTSFFLIWISFFLHNCSHSNSEYIKSAESGHPCFLPDRRGKAYRFVPLNNMLAVGLSYKAFIMLRYVSSIKKFYDE